MASEGTLNTPPAHLLQANREKGIRRRWEMPRELGKLSAGCNWTTVLCLPSLPPILLHLFLSRHPDYHTGRWLPCSCWFTGSVSQPIWKSRSTVKGALSYLESVVSILLPPPLHPYFSSYFNLSEKWIGRNLIPSPPESSDKRSLSFHFPFVTFRLEAWDRDNFIYEWPRTNCHWRL